MQARPGDAGRLGLGQGRGSYGRHALPCQPGSLAGSPRRGTSRSTSVGRESAGIFARLVRPRRVRGVDHGSNHGRRGGRIAHGFPLRERRRSRRPANRSALGGKISRESAARPDLHCQVRLAKRRIPISRNVPKSTTMRGVYCDGTSVRLRRDLPEPEPGPGEVVLQVRARRDLRHRPAARPGLHGFSGRPRARVRRRDATTGAGSPPRSTTPATIARPAWPADPHHCPNRTVLGILGHDGAMADRVARPRAEPPRVPDAIDDREAVFIEPLAAAFRIAEQVELGPGTDDGRRRRRQARPALRLGRPAAPGPRSRSSASTPTSSPWRARGSRPIRSTTPASSGAAFDVVADCTGSPTGLPTALGLVRPCGTVVLKTTVAGDYAIDLAPIVIDEVRVIGSRCGPVPEGDRRPGRRARSTSALDRGRVPARRGRGGLPRPPRRRGRRKVDRSTVG